MGCQLIQHAGAHSAVKHCVGVLRATEHKRQFHGCCVGHNAVEVRSTARHDVNRATAHAIDHGGIVAQLVGWEDGDFNITVGALFDQLGQFHGGCVLAVGGVNRVAHFEVELGCKCGRAHASDQASNENARNFHG